MIHELIRHFSPGNFQILPRLISLVENNAENYQSIYEKLENRAIPVIGLTGPPGAGKSTLLSQIIKTLRAKSLSIAVLAVDPSSPFTHGAVLGDRIRMHPHFNDPGVFIRSIATRGHLGGLSVKTSEIVDLCQCFAFDYIFIETVGVGQSEIEIAGLASCTVVVLVPESGDEIQSIKAGLLEIADILVVNKSDREGAGKLMNILRMALKTKRGGYPTGLLQTISTTGEGVEALMEQCHLQIIHASHEKKIAALTEKVYQMVVRQRMSSFDLAAIRLPLERAYAEPHFNVYQFVREILNEGGH